MERRSVTQFASDGRTLQTDCDQHEVTCFPSGKVCADRDAGLTWSLQFVMLLFFRSGHGSKRDEDFEALDSVFVQSLRKTKVYDSRLISEFSDYTVSADIEDSGDLRHGEVFGSLHLIAPIQAILETQGTDNSSFYWMLLVRYSSLQWVVRTSHAKRRLAFSAVARSTSHNT
jgi:hypothetical protein